MSGGNRWELADSILVKLTRHAEAHPASRDYIGIQGISPAEAPMGLSSPLRKDNLSWMTETELAGTNDGAAVESVRRACLKLWQRGVIESATIRRRRPCNGGESWHLAFRLPANEDERPFCGEWDDWFCRRDGLVWKHVCQTLIGKH